jgi:hypothetical protein
MLAKMKLRCATPRNHSQYRPVVKVVPPNTLSALAAPSPRPLVRAETCVREDPIDCS